MTGNLARVRINQWNSYSLSSGRVTCESMAHIPPIVSDVGYTQQRSLVKDPYSLAARNAVIERTGKLCSGTDSLSVALKLQKHLLGDNDLEAVRDFQEVKEAKNSRILQSVKNAITVTGVQGFQDFLSILGEF